MIHPSSMKRSTLERIAYGEGAEALLATPYALSLPFRDKARRLYLNALRRGVVVPSADGCQAIHEPTGERCGRTRRLSGHHESYFRPLDVVWLCGICHATRHSRLRSARIHMILQARAYLAAERAHASSEAA